VRVLVVGGGGREHALAWGLQRSPRVDDLHAVPGNAGIAQLATCHEGDTDDVAGVASLADRLRPDLVVIGPEAPLVAGLADELRDKGFTVFGPGSAAARLEGSKSWAKDVMTSGGIPTARAGTFSRVDDASAFVDELGGAAVVKADGLAAGKGVTVATDRTTAIAALRDCLEAGAFGQAGVRVVVEELLTGPEVSAFALVEGDAIVPLALGQDFKRVGDGDTGPNTGGMGAYSPVPFVDAAAQDRIWSDVVGSTVRALRDRGISYSGLLYVGLMLTADGPKVLEYNCRFGDPETQVVIPRLSTDLADLLEACATGALADVKATLSPGAAVTVVMASGGYPGAYRTGVEITGLEAADGLDGVTVFHAGTAVADGRVVTAGGRVLAVTANGGSIGDARDRAYRAAGAISFDGASWRTDIALEAARSEGAAMPVDHGGDGA
jgi:phosphoribosylamine--glycine ligase